MIPFQLIQSYLVSLVVFLVIDGLWLGVIARKLYASQLGHLLAETPNWLAAGIFYLLFLVGLQFFVILPALRDGSVQQAVIAGAFFGFITYATYDLTNLATLRDWPILVTIVDLAWGAFLSAVVAGVTVFVLAGR